MGFEQPFLFPVLVFNLVFSASPRHLLQGWNTEPKRCTVCRGGADSESDGDSDSAAVDDDGNVHFADWYYAASESDGGEGLACDVAVDLDATGPLTGIAAAARAEHTGDERIGINVAAVAARGAAAADDDAAIAALNVFVAAKSALALLGDAAVGAASPAIGVAAGPAVNPVGPATHPTGPASAADKDDTDVEADAANGS